MVTKNVVVGTTAKSVLSCAPDELIDLLVQNLSANVLYVGDVDVTTANGIKVVATGSYTNDKQGEPLFLVADGADSDVRLKYEIYKKRSR